MREYIYIFKKLLENKDTGYSSSENCRSLNLSHRCSVLEMTYFQTCGTLEGYFKCL